MKILFIANSLTGGGKEQVLQDILRELSRASHEITVFLIENNGNEKEYVLPGITLQHMHNVRNKEDFFRKREKVTACYRQYLKSDYDVEIAFSEGAPLRMLVCSPNERSRKITWVHGGWYLGEDSPCREYPFFNSMEEAGTAYQKMDKIIFITNSIQRRFEKMFQRIFENKIIIRYPVKKQEIIQRSLEYHTNIEKMHRFAGRSETMLSGRGYDSQFLAVIVGRVENRKGHIRVLYAMSRLFQENCRFHLLIVGDGPEVCSLQELSRLLFISDYVHFIGYQTNPYPYIRNADLLISASIAEEYPMAVCEALALGTPVIATDCSGNAEVLARGRYGYLVENSEEGIYRGIKRIMLSSLDYRVLQEMSREGREQQDFAYRMAEIKRVLEE